LALLEYDCLLIKPFEYKGLEELAEQSRFFWWSHWHQQQEKEQTQQQRTTKLIGHRGLGANLRANSNASQLSSPIGENTVLSFVVAASLGAEYVEFDVQLTRDGIPVLYHDLIVGETGLSSVTVPSLSLKEFQSLKGSRSPETTLHRRMSSSSIVDPRPTRHREAEDAANHGIKDGAAHRIFIEAPFATLKEAFGRVPSGIGFNIELKYPVADELAELGLVDLSGGFQELNFYCDRVLETVFDCISSNRRSVIFSSFHPDVCLILSMKQSIFPVFFLTEAGMTQWPKEPRANSLNQAIRFAKEAGLLGIVSHSGPLMEAPRLIRTIKGQGLLLMTYGSRNNELEAVQLQRRLGVDAVIVDSVRSIHRGLFP